ncbi:unnamed protein product, partial [Ectocarpus sp. 13 AM-2016]
IVEVGLSDVRQGGGGGLRVNAEVAFLACGRREVSLWVPYWVVNATSLPLTLQHYLHASRHSGGNAYDTSGGGNPLFWEGGGAAAGLGEDA